MSSIWFALQLNFSTETITAIPFCYKHHHFCFTFCHFFTAGFNYSVAQSSCYRHDHSLNEWTLLGNLNTARFGHASALLNGNLWMTGGFVPYTYAKLQFPRFLFQTLISGSCHSIFKDHIVPCVFFASQNCN